MAEKNFVYLPQGTTNNLMDYTEGHSLLKPQWDLIHDPQKMLFGWAEEKEEGAILITDSNPILRGFISSIRNNFASKSPYFSKVFDYVENTKDFYLKILPKKNAMWYCYFTPRTGTKSDPHLIVINYEDFYQARISAREISEEFFHAAQHFYHPNQPALNKEVEVRIARAYIYFEMKKNGHDPNTFYLLEPYLKKFLENQSVNLYFQKLYSNQSISSELSILFMNLVKEIAPTINDEYKRQIPNWNPGVSIYEYVPNIDYFLSVFKN